MGCSMEKKHRFKAAKKKRQQVLEISMAYFGKLAKLQNLLTDLAAVDREIEHEFFRIKRGGSSEDMVVSIWEKFQGCGFVSLRQFSEATVKTINEAGFDPQHEIEAGQDGGGGSLNSSTTAGSDEELFVNLTPLVQKKEDIVKDLKLAWESLFVDAQSSPSSSSSTSGFPPPPQQQDH